MGKKVVRVHLDGGSSNNQTVHVNHSNGNELELLRQRINDMERLIKALREVIDEKEKIIQLLIQNDKNNSDRNPDDDKR